MGVYIKDMEMPMVCGACPFCLQAVSNDMAYCLAGGPCERLNIDTRHPHCPLIPVPDHGDLIDRDALMESLADWQYTEAPQEGSNWRIDKMVTSHEAQYEKYLLLKQVYDEVKDFPVMVIPAERDAKVCPLHSDDEVTEYCLGGPCTDEMENRCPIAERR